MENLLGNSKKGLAFILSAPAGTGKTTIVKKLTEEFPCVIKNISYTTRKSRENEINKKDYHFVSQKEFDQKIEAGEFLEYAQVFGNHYGTCRKDIEDLQNQGMHVFLVIDTQGALAIRDFFKAVFIFMSPPSMEELEKRLRNRKTDKEEVIEERLSWAAKEIEIAKYYDYQVVNDSFEVTYQIVKSILIAEEHKTEVLR